MGFVRESVRELGHFKRKPGGRSDRIGKDTRLAKAAIVDGLAFDFGADAGLFTEGKRCADLDACRAEPAGFSQLAGTTVAASQPEGQSERTDFAQLGNIARAVEGFAFWRELKGAPFPFLRDRAQMPAQLIQRLALATISI